MGENYSLICTVYGVDDLVTIISYLWRKDNTLLATTAILSFSPFRLSDAGQYTCEVTIENIMMYSDTHVILATRKMFMFQAVRCN